MAASSAEHALDQTGPAPATGSRPKRAKPHLFITLGLVLAIVFGAWMITGREGIAQLGRGGVNQKILPKPGDVAPDVRLTDPLGNTVTLSSFRGKTVWLNFWGSWCEPCRSEMPDIETAYEQVKDQGVVLLAVSLDEDPLNAALFAYQNQVTFQIYSDEYRTDTGAAYPIYNFPTHIFIDKNGIVRHVVLSEMNVQDAVHYAEETVNGT